MKKKGLAILLAIAMIFGFLGIFGNASVAEAAKTVLTVGADTPTQIVLIPGQTTQVKIPLRLTEGYVISPKFELVASEGAPIEVGPAEVYQIIGTTYYKDYITLSPTMDTYVHFAIHTKETAKIGKYELRIKCVDYLDNSFVSEEGGEPLNDVVLSCIVSEELMPAELAISSLSLSGTWEPGGTGRITFTVTNTGEIEAKNVRLSADYSGGLLLPEYTDYTKKLGDMKSKASQRVSLTVKILETVQQRVVQLPIVITYKDSDGASYTADTNNILYLEIELPETDEDFENGTLLVSNVKQSPAKPKAGEKVSLTFDMENTGEKDYTDTKIYIDYVSGTGFEPVKAEPYQYVGTIKAGQKKTVTVNVIAGKEIDAGMNVLGVKYTYKDGRKEEVPGSVTLYVLDVQKAEESAGLSRPKLMVSEFSTNMDVIKSGEEFDFTFKVYNTHSETTAKNIKVTVTSEMFSVTKGSNSFFLSKIAPEDSAEITINLKASAAAMTGSYPVNIQMEYEYDGMPVSESNAGGVTVTETKMLLIKENLRVSVENVAVGGWNTPFANQPTQLSFSIYNMGKSTLNNVYFTVDGDFAVANGSSYYYGTLQAGYPDYVEMDIIPLVAGDATGTLTIHMEDSNGDEVTYVSDLNAYIMEMGSGENNWDVPDIPTDVDPMPEPVEQAKPLVSIPVFAGILVVAFLLSFFVTRGIRIACYKRKLRKEQE
ncbi:MAG: hypothetical protein PUC73_08450 [Lachnospiraceae bacterium]|nr:hypothetical protein [Lachnospiraceae bacterium]